MAVPERSIDEYRDAPAGPGKVGSPWQVAV
jgi:hypothetical protein